MLTFDPAFQQKRRLIHARNRPRHAIGGVVASAKHLFTGLSSGITGIVEKPVEGAKESGAAGFFKGVGVGLVGAVVKPIVGVFDATTSLTEGIKNTADADASDLTQVRLPRPVPHDGVLRPYSEYEAKGQYFLYALHQKQFQDSASAFRLQQLRSREYYVAHLGIPSDEQTALITTLSVSLVDPSSVKYIWKVPFDELVYVRPHRDVILVVVRQKNIRQRMIFVADPALQEWFCSKVEEAVLIYNQTRYQTA